MSSNISMSGFEMKIQSEIEIIQDQATSRTIYELIQHGKKKEKEAENRKLRPRPDGTENAAFYRNAIDFTLIPSVSLIEAIEGLLSYLEEIEQILADAD